MNRCLKRVVPLIIALAATGAWANEAENATNAANATGSQAMTPGSTDYSPSTTQSSTLVPGRITLYEYPNLAGPRVTVDSSNAVAQNLDWAAFNNSLHRAESARVESGTWRVCSLPQFQGTCRTIGPGDYAYLDMPEGIASAEPVLSPQLGSLQSEQIVIVPDSQTAVVISGTPPSSQ
jgi:hypothetical protein